MEMKKRDQLARSKPGSVILNRYRLGRFLGQGTFAKVYEAKSLAGDGEGDVAVKIIDKTDKSFDATMESLVAGEIEAMRRLRRHPNILRIVEVMATKTKIYLVVELAAGGELLRKIADRPNFLLKESQARRYFHQLVSALRFCHNHGVAHRDIKPQNLLLDSSGNLKVSDFGLSALPERAGPDGALRTACGTPAFTAPEVMAGRRYDGAKADAWSCGVILHVLLAGKLPFGTCDGNIPAMCRKMKERDIDFSDKMSSSAKKLVYRLLDPNPTTRLSVEALADTMWLRRSLSATMGAEEPLSLFDHHHKPVTAEVSPALADRNAFEIISMSAGLDLSGLFGKRREERKFAAAETTAEAAVERVREAAEKIGFRTERSKGGRTAGMGKGSMVFVAEALEVSDGLVLGGVRVIDGSGDFGEALCWDELKTAVGDHSGVTWLNNAI